MNNIAELFSEDILLELFARGFKGFSEDSGPTGFNSGSRGFEGESEEQAIYSMFSDLFYYVL